MRVLGIATLAGLALVASCGGGSDGGTTGPPEKPVFTVLRVAPAVIVLRPNQSKAITATALDQRGNAITTATGFTYTSSNTSIATVTSNGSVTGVANGTATITVSLTLDGSTKAAQMEARVTDQPAPGAVSVVASSTADVFTPKVVEVAVGGTVTWQFGTVVHNVSFDGGTGAPTRIPDTANADVSRTFTVEGSFDYQCTLHAGMTGTVIVR